MLVPRNVFCVAKCADAEASRYALGGVRFERRDGQPFAVATDGRRLLAVSWTETDAEDLKQAGNTEHVQDFATIVPIKACQEAGRGLGIKVPAHVAKRKPALTQVLIEEPRTNGVVPMVTTNMEDTRQAAPQALEGRFPMWEQVFPKRDSVNGVTVCVNPKMLGELLLAMADVMGDDASREYGVMLTLPRDGKDHGQAITISQDVNGTKTLGVIMPLANDKPKEAPQPKWLAKL